MTQAEKIKQKIDEKKENKQESKPAEKQKNTLQTEFEKMRPELEKVLPSQFEPDRMIRLLTSVAKSNPDVLKDRAGFWHAALEAASLGLEPNTTLGECYIIGYKKNGRMTANLQLGYKGILKLAYNTREYKAIYAHPVYANDEFHYQYGLHKDLVHVPADMEEGEPTHYYAVYHLKNGGFDFRVMSTDSIKEHANRYSKGIHKSTSVWKSDFDGMALKTVLLAVLKYAPKASSLANALETDTKQQAEIIDGEFRVVDEEQKKLAEA